MFSSVFLFYYKRILYNFEILCYNLAVVTTQSDSGKGVYVVVILNASTTSRDRRSRSGLPTNLQVARQSR